MKKSFNSPYYRTVNYELNAQTGYYTKTKHQHSPVPVMSLPFEIRRTFTQAEKIKVNAKELLISREKNKKKSYKFITGIQETSFFCWYIGNHYEYIKGEKITSLILFHFANDNSQLTAYFFPKYDKSNSAERMRFADFIIPQIIGEKLKHG